MLGPYEVMRELQSGGMARAVLCRAPSGRLVVAKVPLQDHTDLFARLRDEARVGSRVAHEHLIETLVLFEEAGRPVLIVGYVEGTSMNELCAKALPPACVARIGWQIASALRALHEATDDQGAPLRVVHRDVSGGNILV